YSAEADGGGEEGEETPPSGFVTISLAAQPGGSQPGEGFLSEAAPGVSFAGIEITAGLNNVPQPAHLHTGNCAQPGPIVYPLASVYNGGSFTILSAGSDEITAQNLILNVHLSQAQA